MDDITLPQEHSRDDDDAFFIRPVREDAFRGATEWGKPSKPPVPEESEEESSVAATTSNGVRPEANDWIRIQFGRFVQLVANHGFLDIVDKNAEEEIIISSNLLTDLANANDRSREKRMPMIFIAGLVIGILLTYILVK